MRTPSLIPFIVSRWPGTDYFTVVFQGSFDSNTSQELRAAPHQQRLRLEVRTRSRPQAVDLHPSSRFTRSPITAQTRYWKPRQQPGNDGRAPERPRGLVRLLRTRTACSLGRTISVKRKRLRLFRTKPSDALQGRKANKTKHESPWTPRRRNRNRPRSRISRARLPLRGP
jgi:hypothetical protein